MEEQSKKKILIFSLAYYPKLIGGAEIAIKEITDRIHEYDFVMITIRGDHNYVFEKIGNVSVYRVGLQVNPEKFLGKIIFKITKYLYPFLAYKKAKKLHKSYKFITVWSIMANHAGFAALFFKKKFKNVRFLLTLQEGDPISYIKRKVFFVYPWFKQIFKHADYVQAISNYLLNFAKSMGYKGKGNVIGNGVNIKLFSKELEAHERIDVRSKYGFSENDIVLVTASRLVKKNGVSDIISALKILPEEYKLLIIGSGELEEKLKSQISNLELENRAVMIGYIPYETLPKFFKSSDIFIRPSLSEGLGNAFLEAMASGIPVIATAVGGIPDIVSDRKTGIFCEVKNPESISNAVKKLEDAGLRKTVIENAKIQSASFSWEIISQKIKEIL